MEMIEVPDLHLMIKNGSDVQAGGCTDGLMDECFGGCVALILGWGYVLVVEGIEGS